MSEDIDPKNYYAMTTRYGVPVAPSSNSAVTLPATISQTERQANWKACHEVWNAKAKPRRITALSSTIVITDALRRVVTRQELERLAKERAEARQGGKPREEGSTV